MESDPRTDVLVVYANPVLQPWAQPYGAMIVRDAVLSRGLLADVVLPYLRKNPLAWLKQTLKTRRPRIVGLSFRNLDTAGFRYESNGEQHYLDQLRSFARISRESGCIVAIGGSGYSIAPELIMNEIPAHVGFVGTCETDFAEFCERTLRQNLNLDEATDGLRSIVKPNEAPAIPPNRIRLPVLQATSLHPEALEYARLTGATIPVRTKTGCSLRCTYCVVPWIETTTYRNWQDIRTEIQMIVDADMGEAIFIADGEFNLPSVDRAIEICQQIKHEFGGCVQWRCYLSEKQITEKLISALVDAGCVAVSISVDALVDETRQGFAKGSSTQAAMSAVRHCLAAELRTNVNMLFGGPNETPDTLRLGAERAAVLHEEGALLSVTVGLRVYPGTPLEKQAKLPQYKRYYRQCKDVPWLGVFCSPSSPAELADLILPILAPQETITYTGGLSHKHTSIDSDLAAGAVALANRDLDRARTIFERISQEEPERLEPELGLLKTKYYATDRSNSAVSE